MIQSVMNTANSANKEKVIDHYNQATEYWHRLWGVHIHHGYWKEGNETKEKAQEQLIDELATQAGIKPGMKIIDVGCGIGGSAIYLAKKYKAHMSGVTISPVQVEMAKDYAKSSGVEANFFLGDAERLELSEKYDVVWSVEAVSHFDNPESFFSLAGRLLDRGGRIAMTDWLKAENLSQSDERYYIDPIRYGMMSMSLKTMSQYCDYAKKYGFKVILSKDISEKVSKSWDIGLDIISDINLWKMALSRGMDFVSFLKSVRSMKRGFSSKTFVYGMIVAEKI